MKESHDFLKTWQERYFVVDCRKGTLTYYLEAGKVNPKGDYKFNASSVCDACNSNSSRPYMFVLRVSHIWCFYVSYLFPQLLLKMPEESETVLTSRVLRTPTGQRS